MNKKAMLNYFRKECEFYWNILNDADKEEIYDTVGVCGFIESVAKMLFIDMSLFTLEELSSIL